MKTRFGLMVATALLTSALAPAQEFGRYEGVVQTQWLPDGRKMKLLSPLKYFDKGGGEWIAPLGSVIDGASIPPFAWSIIGGPFEGKYRDASIIHDVACVERVRTWESVHETFYYGMLCSGVSTIKAKIIYGAVYYFGPRWEIVYEFQSRKPSTLEAEVKKVRSQVHPNSSVEVIARPRLPPMSASFPGGGGPWKSIPSKDLARIADVVKAKGLALPEDVDAIVVVKPPLNEVREDQFRVLENEIAAKEIGASGGMTLEEIRKFFPTGAK